MAGELDRDRADPTGTADHQQAPAAVGLIVETVGHALEQQLPCGQCGQRQGRGLGEVQGVRLAPDDAFVDKLELRIGATG